MFSDIKTTSNAPEHHFSVFNQNCGQTMNVLSIESQTMYEHFSLTETNKPIGWIAMNLLLNGWIPFTLPVASCWQNILYRLSWVLDNNPPDWGSPDFFLVSP